MFLWAIYIFPGSVYIFPPAEQADPSWEYIIRSQTQTHEAPIFLFWEYLFQIFAILSLQCVLNTVRYPVTPKHLYKSTVLFIFLSWRKLIPKLGPSSLKIPVDTVFKIWNGFATVRPAAWHDVLDSCRQASAQANPNLIDQLTFLSTSLELRSLH